MDLLKLRKNKDDLKAYTLSPETLKGTQAERFGKQSVHLVELPFNLTTCLFPEYSSPGRSLLPEALALVILEPRSPDL